MRTSSGSVPSGGHRLLLAAVATAWLVAGCGAAAVATPTPLPTPTATPVPSRTPQPPLTAPASADAVYLALLADGLVIAPLDADAGINGRDPVKRIHATYEGWPLAISQFMTAKSLASGIHWAAGTKPGRGEAPIAFIGENILVQWGPIATTKGPTTPDADHLASAGRLRDALNGLVGPLKSRTIVPIPATPAASPGSSPAAGASAAPSAKP